MKNSDFLGKGMKFPPKLSGGAVAFSEGEELIRESIELILMTTPGERLMRPDFGCELKRLAFVENSVTTHSRVAYAVEEALNKWEHRIQVESVDVTVDESEGNKLNIDIEYRLLSNNLRFNMVFPFYLERE